MRHIINIVGPAAVGKSTVIRSLNEHLPQYEVLAIDNFRCQLDASMPDVEAQAWRELWVAALKAEYSIIESCGTSQHLSMILERLWRAPGTNILTIALEAPVKVCLKRAQQRRKLDTFPPGLSQVASPQKWIPLSELSIGLRFDAKTATAAQLAEAILGQLPIDFL